MKIDTSISGEHFDHKIAGIFDDEGSAKSAADAISKATSLRANQIFVIGPNDRHPGWELEPEDKGIWHTMLKAHLWLGIVGGIVGFVLFLILFSAGIAFVVQNATTTAAITTGFGIVVGMMFGGLVTLRPDHMPYVSVSQSALRKGKFIVAVHATSADQLKEANLEFDRLHIKTVSSL
ncbi:MAG: hypothetical protein WA987_16725 [Cellvibrio sp.]|jgi:hypothetical protein